MGTRTEIPYGVVMFDLMFSIQCCTGRLPRLFLDIPLVEPIYYVVHVP